MHLAAAAAALALGLPGAHASATYSPGTLGLTLHYEMTCGQPGPGPLTIQLPSAFRLGDVAVTGHTASVRGHSVTVTIPGPTGVTCMSIAEGTLHVRVTGVTAPAGSYVVHAAIRRYTFAAHLHVG